MLIESVDKNCGKKVSTEGKVVVLLFTSPIIYGDGCLHRPIIYDDEFISELQVREFKVNSGWLMMN